MVLLRLSIWRGSQSLAFDDTLITASYSIGVGLLLPGVKKRLAWVVYDIPLGIFAITFVLDNLMDRHPTSEASPLPRVISHSCHCGYSCWYAILLVICACNLIVQQNSTCLAPAQSTNRMTCRSRYSAVGVNGPSASPSNVISGTGRS